MYLSVSVYVAELRTPAQMSDTWQLWHDQPHIIIMTHLTTRKSPPLHIVSWFNTGLFYNYLGYVWAQVICLIFCQHINSLDLFFTKHQNYIGTRVLPHQNCHMGSISPMHHNSKQRRQKAWDDGVAPSVHHVQANMHWAEKAVFLTGLFSRMNLN